MAGISRISADDISESVFRDCLSKYTSCIEAIAQSKGSKKGGKTLKELDKYRYEDATTTFGCAEPGRAMELDDVKDLVSWKLRHGTFRPTLMKLVSSNDPQLAKDTIQQAIAAYRATSDVSAAVNSLTRLRGVGPATASLLLAVHDPERVVFFADEAFYWLCCGGQKGTMKYSMKEYADLHERARVVCKRLGARAVDVERVAFAVMMQPGSSAGRPSRIRTGTDGEGTTGKSRPQGRGAREDGDKGAPSDGGHAQTPRERPTKRKVGVEDAEARAHETGAPLRRSKRRMDAD